MKGQKGKKAVSSKNVDKRAENFGGAVHIRREESILTLQDTFLAN